MKDVELPEIEEIQENPQDTIIKYLTKHNMIVDTIARSLLGESVGRTSYWLKKMELDGILASEKKMVKMSDDNQFRSRRVYKLAGKKK